jgi:hypothetical protein
MALDPIAITVREGDSFDELYLNIEKPWGTPYDYSNSVLVADIRRYFNNTTDAAVDSFGIVEIDPTEGVVQLRLTSRQTEALGRNIPLAYEERGISQSGISFGVDPSDEPQGKFLWDLREYYTTPQATISGISSGTAFTSAAGVTSNRVRITTTTPHKLTERDQILITGTGQTVYDGVDFYSNDLAIISSTIFEIVPTTAGAPVFSVGASSGTISVYKEDTLAIGTLEVIPRISRDSVS